MKFVIQDFQSVKTNKTVKTSRVKKLKLMKTLPIQQPPWTQQLKPSYWPKTEKKNMQIVFKKVF